MTERILNTSIKQPLGASPNTLLFGTSFLPDKTLLTAIDIDATTSKPRSVRDYVDTLIDRQSQIIEAAIQSQVFINEDNLRKRYANYTRIPKIRSGKQQDTDDNDGTTEPISIAYILTAPRPRPIFAAAKWVSHINPVTGIAEYIRVIQSEPEIIDTIDEIDTSPYVLTTYDVNDYVLRRYPSSKIGGGQPT
jgi:hypothetical protein